MQSESKWITHPIRRSMHVQRNLLMAFCKRIYTPREDPHSRPRRAEFCGALFKQTLAGGGKPSSYNQQRSLCPNVPEQPKRISNDTQSGWRGVVTRTTMTTVFGGSQRWWFCWCMHDDAKRQNDDAKRCWCNLKSEKRATPKVKHSSLWEAFLKIVEQNLQLQF